MTKINYKLAKLSETAAVSYIQVLIIIMPKTSGKMSCFRISFRLHVKLNNYVVFFLYYYQKVSCFALFSVVLHIWTRYWLYVMSVFFNFLRNETKRVSLKTLLISTILSLPNVWRHSGRALSFWYDYKISQNNCWIVVALNTCSLKRHKELNTAE
jgi:hypothetical protein